MKKPYSREDAEEVKQRGMYEGIPIEIIQKLGFHEGGFSVPPSREKCEIEMLRQSMEKQKEKTTFPDQIQRLIDSGNGLVRVEGNTVLATKSFPPIAKELKKYYADGMNTMLENDLQRWIKKPDGSDYKISSIQQAFKSS
jgi:hypothetical protein